MGREGHPHRGRDRRTRLTRTTGARHHGGRPPTDQIGQIPMTAKAQPRQVCCRCLASVAQYTTVTNVDGRRFHFCTNHQDDARSLYDLWDGQMILTPSNMHAAFDPNGREVWCTFAERLARTNDGFCQYCGSTDHEPPTKLYPEACPACGADLKRQGYPLGHQHAETGHECTFQCD